ncbi:MAG: 6-phosphofructokinase [Fusobacteria bacterium]|nr:6-phosphofructokinase [Fusobacteriota bacterium]
MKSIAILTSGGDSPGMNTAIRAAAKYAFSKGVKVFGIRRGYTGMLNDDIFEIEPKDVSGIIDRGGTMLLTARCMEFHEAKHRQIAADNLRKREIEGVVVIGGDGSYRGAKNLSDEHPDIKIVGIPGTIDNDIAGTDNTIGFDTALNTVLEAIAKIRDTATSHERTYFLEVMGRGSGELALYSCLAGGGDGLFIPEKGFAMNDLADVINTRRKKGKLSDLVIISEGTGSATEIAERLKNKINSSVRVTILGHVQRGGSPSAMDRILATKLGAFAIEELINGKDGIMVGIESNKLTTYPLSYSWENKKVIDDKDYELAITLAK